ncbi:MAG: hypothetical protein ACOY31_09820 [Bacillota bacterium]
MIIPVDMYRITQIYPTRKLKSIEETIQRELDTCGLNRILNTGDSVAITAGSRGISNIVLILEAVVRYVASCGSCPTILSSMGSHGGGTVSGQLEVLKGLGITEEKMGVPVVAGVETINIAGENGRACPVNRLAFNFDHIIVINRIKPHTSFHGDHESGLLKMLAVGLGGPEGASVIHSPGVNQLAEAIPAAASVMLKKLPVAVGLAIVEDAFDNTMDIRAVRPEDFVQTERILLEEARRNMPRLPFDHIDILVVDEMGKTFSGTGLDTNIIGRLKIWGSPEPESPCIKRIVVLGLDPGSKGNAYGIGLADFTTERLVKNINREAMYKNAFTSTFTQRAMIPITLPDDRSAIMAAIDSLGTGKAGGIRLVRIKNTLHIESMMVSEPLAAEARANKSLIVSESPLPLSFDENKNLLPF